MLLHTVAPKAVSRTRLALYPNRRNSRRALLAWFVASLIPTSTLAKSVGERLRQPRSTNPTPFMLSDVCAFDGPAVFLTAGYLYAILRLCPYSLLPSLAISVVVWNDHRYGGPLLGDWGA